VAEPYRIFNVRRNPDSLRATEASEFMGSKEKVWLRHRRTGRYVMLKVARSGSGEDWSEKVAYEVARLLGIPCPRVELASWDERPAVLCWDFRGRRLVGDEPQRRWDLLHGNELLGVHDPEYPASGSFRASKHTVSAVAEALEGCEHLVRNLVDPHDALSAFVGYLLLDAWIGNTDRHHENWGVVVGRRKGDHDLTAYLSPSYDHASALGRELSDDKRMRRLFAKGRGTVPDYAEKATSALWTEGEVRTLSTFEALSDAGQRRPKALRD